MLNSRQLRQLRAINNQFLPDRCTIQRDTRTSDGKGGTTLVSSTLAANVMCRLSRTSTGRGAEMIQGGRLTSVGDWTIYLPHGQAIDEKDRVVITTLSSRRFEVVQIQETSYSIGIRVVAKELD